MSSAIRENVDLQAFNTLGLSARAAHFVELSNEADLAPLLARAQAEAWPVQLLGGGSNIVFAGDVSGLTIRLNLRGIRVIGDKHESDSGVIIEAAAGEPWHEFTQYTLADRTSVG